MNAVLDLFGSNDSNIDLWAGWSDQYDQVLSGISRAWHFEAAAAQPGGWQCQLEVAPV
jgi:hypothetical protein